MLTDYSVIITKFWRAIQSVLRPLALVLWFLHSYSLQMQLISLVYRPQHYYVIHIDQRKQDTREVDKIVEAFIERLFFSNNCWKSRDEIFVFWRKWWQFLVCTYVNYLNFRLCQFSAVIHSRNKIKMKLMEILTRFIERVIFFLNWEMTYYLTKAVCYDAV